MTNNPSTNPTGGQDPNAGPPSQELNSGGQDPNETANKPPLSREAYEAIIADLRTKDAEKRIKLKEFEEAQRKQQEAEQAREQQRLKEQGEWQKIAEQNEKLAKEYSPFKERYETLSTRLASQIKEEIKDWPDEVKALDPGETTSVEDRMAWLEKSRALVKLIQDQQASRTGIPGNSPNPKPAGPMSIEQRTEKQIEQLRRSGRYGTI